MVMGEGKRPSKEHLLKLARVGNIKEEKALTIINQVSKAVEKWKAFGENTGVSKLQIKNIGETLK
jgi:serine/threonine-protein kinase HipA